MSKKDYPPIVPYPERANRSKRDEMDEIVLYLFMQLMENNQPPGYSVNSPLLDRLKHLVFEDH